MSEELEDILRHITSDDDNRIKAINQINEDDQLALLLESLPIKERIQVWNEIDNNRRLEVLISMRHDPRESIIEASQLNELDALFDGMAADQLIELAETLPQKLVDRALRLMDQKQIEYFEQANQFSADEIGHWVNHNLLMLPATSKVRDSLRLIRRETPIYTDAILLIDRSGRFHGAVQTNELIGIPDHTPMTEILIEDYPILRASDDMVEAARKVLNSGFSSLAVVDASEKLIGRIDIGLANEIIIEDLESQIMASAGLDEQEDLFSPVSRSIRGRSIWLGINLVTALLASWFIGLFEATLESVVALAVLMPVVASMGGIAGSQTLALIIRGLALGQVNETNSRILLDKEFKVGLVSGAIWSVAIAIVAYYWFDSMMIGIVIALAILVNIIAASISGLLVPIALKKLNFDPALSGAVILTTITDIVGFVVFLGLGTLLLV
jgi:magnesium transporter